MTYSAYESCTKCAGKAQPGAVALLKYMLLKFPYGRSLGIYNCRYIAGTTTLSNHSCGCAIDFGLPTTSSGGARPELGNPVVKFLDEFSSALGVTEQIYNRVRYTRTYPSGKYYGGVSPHNDHNHLSITKAKGLSLTFDQIVAVAGSPTPEGEDDLSIKKGDPVSRACAEAQHAMKELWGYDNGTFTPFVGKSVYTGKAFGPGEDGDPGTTFEANVIRFQKNIQQPQTGILDAFTASYLLAKFGTGGSTAPAPVDAYTKAQSDVRYAAKVHGHTATTTSTTKVT